MKPLLVLDPAHGGQHRGVVGPKGTAEADLNLRVALRLAMLLEGLPLELRLTRHGDVSVPKSERHQLLAEAKWALQLHHGGVSQREPIEIWVAPRAPKEVRQLSSVLLASMKKELGVEGRIIAPPDRFGVESKNPKFPVFKRAPRALLVSTGYLHTPMGEESLNEEWVKGETRGLYCGAMSWFSL